MKIVVRFATAFTPRPCTLTMCVSHLSYLENGRFPLSSGVDEMGFPVRHCSLMSRDANEDFGLFLTCVAYPDLCKLTIFFLAAPCRSFLVKFFLRLY